jgi:hypothetical protein
MRPRPVTIDPTYSRNSPSSRFSSRCFIPTVDQNSSPQSIVSDRVVLERDDFKALVEHGIKAAGSRDKLLTDSAVELLFRVCRCIPRIASRLLRAALKEAHARNQNVVDDSALKAAVEPLTLGEEVKP